MKLIDILVEELPKRGGWPEGAARLAQDPDGDIQMLSNRHAYLVSVGWTGDGRMDCYCQYAVRKLEPLASDYATAIITREQYEAALAAKNDDWIEWGGGECPLVDDALVEVRYRNEELYHIKGINAAGKWNWQHVGYKGDIIAYRLHQPQQAEQPEAGEEDLNDCIGQAPAPLWNGEGLVPHVGCACERSWAGDEWQPCKALFTSDQIIVVKLKESGMEDAYNVGDVTFRPIRSKEDEKRNDRASAIDGFISGFRGQKIGSNKELAYALTDYLALIDKL